jgi:hypothetical protein
LEEENEDSLIVDDFEDEDSTKPSTVFELAIIEENPELASLLEDAITDLSSMNSEIISATAEDLSEIVSGISAKELESVVETICSSFDEAC